MRINFDNTYDNILDNLETLHIDEIDSQYNVIPNISKAGEDNESKKEDEPWEEAEIPVSAIGPKTVRVFEQGPNRA